MPGVTTRKFVLAIADLIAATSCGEATTPSTPDASANFTSRITDSAGESVTPI
jgi:hypothetical protein